MNGTEFLFSFFGLLLGLAIANIATGFGEIWRGRQRWRIGWATPLLGLFVMLAVSQQWLAFWIGRELLDIRPALLLAAVLVAFPTSSSAPACIRAPRTAMNRSTISICSTAAPS